jgi:hypothetical protein
MEYQRTINELATWEIDSMIEMYGNKLLNLFPSLFDEYPKSIPKLHKRRNSFSNDEYDRFVSCPVLPYSELIDTIKNEPMTDHSVLESPLFDEDCISSPDSYGIRIPLKSNISSTFQISYCLEYFESEVLEGRCKEGNVTFVAGELNHKSYGELKNYYFDLILGKGLKTIKHIDCFAGPHLSCPDEYKIDHDSLEKSNFFIHLFLSNQYQDKIRLYKVKQRKRYHFIVHEFNDKLCLIEDPHPEFCERSASVVFNNPVLCQKLRDIAKTCYADSARLVDEKDIRACLMPESEIRKRTEQNGC